MDLNGKVAIVTGAGSGIGHAIAERFAAAGASVCVNYLGYEEEAKALAQRLPKAIALKADVSKVGEVQALVDTTVREPYCTPATNSAIVAVSTGSRTPSMGSRSRMLSARLLSALGTM